MANLTFLQLVNKVLVRMRETQTVAVATNDYTTMIGEFINISKTDIEASWTWRVNRSTVDVSVLGDSTTVLYSLTGAGNQFKPISVWNVTGKYQMRQISDASMDQKKIQVPAATIPQAQIIYFCYRGVDGSGDTQIEIYPVANTAQTIRFRLAIPQADLSADGDVIRIPSKPVIEAAVSLAISERGEDGGIPASVQAGRAKMLLSDAIQDDMALTGDDEQVATAQPSPTIGLV